MYAMTRNFLLYQYGADQTQLIDPKYVKKYIRYLDKEFHFIAGIIFNVSCKLIEMLLLPGNINVKLH